MNTFNEGSDPEIRAERNQLRLILMLVGVVGIVLIVVGQWQSNLEAEIATNLGIALLTAAVLGVVLETYLRERLFLRIEQRVGQTMQSFGVQMADAILMQRLPPLLIQATKKQILEPAIVLRDTQADYRFSVITADDQKFLRAVVISSTVYENMSTQDERVELFEGGSTMPESLKSLKTTQDAGFSSITTEVMDGEISPNFNANREQLRPFFSIQGGQPQIKRQLTFSPRSRAKVSTEEIAYFELVDFEEWSHSKPAINLEVTASFEGGNFNLGGESDYTLVESWDSSVDDEKSHGTWRIIGAMLPGQGLSFWWSPKGE